MILQAGPAFESASRSLPHGIVPEGAVSELDLLHSIVDRVRLFDPDILSGWEVQSSSWGYVSKRMANYHRESLSSLRQLLSLTFVFHSVSLATEISPATSVDADSRPSQYNAEQSTEFQVEGRHVFNLWRLIRGDLTLNQYTIENVAFHLLHRR